MHPLSSRLRVDPVDFDDYTWITNRLRWAIRLVRFLAKEILPPHPHGPVDLFRIWSCGFGKRAGLLYNLESGIRHEYVSDFAQSVRGPRINGFYDHVLNNKLLLPILLQWAGAPCPELLGSCFDGRSLVDPRGSATSLLPGVERLLDRHRRFVVKPVKGRKGQGFVSVSLSQGTLRVNQLPSGSGELLGVLAGLGPFLITEFIEQAAYARRLNPSTTNTIRILTMIDPETGAPFIGAAAQRIGNRRSFPTDNWRAGSGGYSSEVDPLTGRLSAGASLNQNWKVEWYPVHPETGVPIEGVVVPHWKEIASAILGSAARLSFAAQIGWDVVVTEAGFSVIEVNGCPGLFLHQVHRPLLADPRVRRLYESRRIPGKRKTDSRARVR